MRANIPEDPELRKVYWANRYVGLRDVQSEREEAEHRTRDTKARLLKSSGILGSIVGLGDSAVRLLNEFHVENARRNFIRAVDAETGEIDGRTLERSRSFKDIDVLANYVATESLELEALQTPEI